MMWSSASRTKLYEHEFIGSSRNYGAWISSVAVRGLESLRHYRCVSDWNDDVHVVNLYARILNTTSPHFFNKCTEISA